MKATRPTGTGCQEAGAEGITSVKDTPAGGIQTLPAKMWMVNVKYGRDSLKAAGRATLSGEIPDLSKLGRIYTRRLEPAARIATFVEAVNEHPVLSITITT